MPWPMAKFLDDIECAFRSKLDWYSFAGQSYIVHVKPFGTIQYAQSRSQNRTDASNHKTRIPKPPVSTEADFKSEMVAIFITTI